jgi:hypothetical protein
LGGSFGLFHRSEAFHLGPAAFGDDALFGLNDFLPPGFGQFS